MADGVTEEPKVRAVFDTTVYIDGLFVTGSPSSKVLREIKRSRLQLITSPSILGEFQSVVQNARFRQTEMRAWLWATGLASLPNVTVVIPPDIPHTVPGDPMDDHVIAAAVEGKADYIVATDHHLLSLKQFQGIRIVTPDEFLVIIGVSKALPDAGITETPEAHEAPQTPEGPDAPDRPGPPAAPQRPQRPGFDGLAA